MFFRRSFFPRTFQTSPDLPLISLLLMWLSLLIYHCEKKQSTFAMESNGISSCFLRPSNVKGIFFPIADKFIYRNSLRKVLPTIYYKNKKKTETINSIYSSIQKGKIENTMDPLYKIGFIGGGMMATSIVKGVIRANVYEAKNIIVSDPYAPPEKFTNDGCQFTTSNSDVIQYSEIIVLAVKPYMIPTILAEVASGLPSRSNNPLIISIAAGVNLLSMESIIPSVPVIRVMPNTPCLVGEGAAAYSPGNKVTAANKLIVEDIFSSVGIIKEVPESLLDAVTGVSGSGPAYIFMLIEALSDGGVRNGLPRDTAIQLAAQTVKGAAEMVLKTGGHPGVLKDQVTSPGGTTIAAVEALEQNGFRYAAISAVNAAANKSKDLSK